MKGIARLTAARFFPFYHPLIDIVSFPAQVLRGLRCYLLYSIAKWCALLYCNLKSFSDISPLFALR